jgi:hypothetical protein
VIQYLLVCAARVGVCHKRLVWHRQAPPARGSRRPTTTIVLQQLWRSVGHKGTVYECMRCKHASCACVSRAQSRLCKNMLNQMLADCWRPLVSAPPCGTTRVGITGGPGTHDGALVWCDTASHTRTVHQSPNSRQRPMAARAHCTPECMGPP